ncbi:tubulin--tyrosine ligase-like protein 12 [Polistes fuscatus]|uniref:tubulin--tyrosine ligase-like protein 12 n=1 Tax=Polistes fuscatus TaxID=30207 RepID=UPI001CA9AC5C|nr:tubulin--tyrosine ligase-like protein 12 [Polistes fuscatus]XP_043491993.1 tubulin--tyrosine ligase-like protein 12 [Polistes fuscatus]XP_043491994.1 tubulin--tyrosine ligase-like protein 12 [Polistes fuscatus]
MDGIGLYRIFLQTHQPQLKSSGVPKIFWEALFNKLKNQDFDAGLAFQLARIDYEDDEREPKDPIWKLFVSAENGISMIDPNNIYLVDHAWTYDTLNARDNLTNVPGLLDRMCSLMGYDIDNEENEKIEFVLKEMWRYNQSFSLNSGTIEDRMPIWYIMDEVGSAINHSDNPNFRTVPFLYLPEGVTYTLLFPVKDVKFEEEVTRDFIDGQTSDLKKRQALLLPWIDNSFINKSFVQESPSEDYFLAGHILEDVPDKINVEEAIVRGPNEKLKVYSQYSFVNNYLTDPAFEIVDREEDADILWYTSHFKEYKELSFRMPHVFVNQFPFENILTIKDLLCIVCRRKVSEKSYDVDTLETYPLWLPTTYNLNTELIQFVAYFEQRESKNLDNLWICKPWNLARGLDTHITDNLFHILRLPSTGPKIAQKYISRPVLYDRPEIGYVKFDIRYVVMLRSVSPLKAYAYSNFFLRFANKEFALNNFDVYEQHFTVMNYSENTDLCHLKCADFIVEWEKQYPDYPWTTFIEPTILNMFKDVFEAAVAEKPPKGIAHFPQSRAVYAIDLMLEWNKGEMQPILLEINFSPDCKRACEYYPDFYNDIFNCLFLDKYNPDVFHDLFPTSSLSNN